jgi:hypothetical protein
MRGELARKRPANVTPSRGQAQVLEAATEPDLYRELARLSRHGELHSAGAARQEGEAWQVPIIRIPGRRRPRWSWRWTLVVAVPLVLAALLWLLVKLLAALAVALTALLPIALVFLVVVGMILLLGGRSTIEVIQRVTIKR